MSAEYPVTIGSGCILTSRDEFFIISEESENPEIPREYTKENRELIVPCAEVKEIRISRHASKIYFCGLADKHTGKHEATRPVHPSRWSAEATHRVIARWLD